MGNKYHHILLIDSDLKRSEHLSSIFQYLGENYITSNPDNWKSCVGSQNQLAAIFIMAEEDIHKTTVINR